MSAVVIRGLDVVLEHGGDPDDFVVLYRAKSPEDAREAGGILRDNLDRYAEENRGAAAFDACIAECVTYAAMQRTHATVAGGTGRTTSARRAAARVVAAREIAAILRELKGNAT